LGNEVRFFKQFEPVFGFGTCFEGVYRSCQNFILVFGILGFRQIRAYGCAGAQKFRGKRMFLFFFTKILVQDINPNRKFATFFQRYYHNLNISNKNTKGKKKVKEKEREKKNIHHGGHGEHGG
jgi:hypothetical protein